MKVLITGGAGFLGLTLARQLCAKTQFSLGQDLQGAIDCILLVDMLTPQIRPEGLDERVSFVAGDISDRAVVGKLVDRDDIVIFHLASVVSAGGEADFDLAIRVNLTGTLNILEAARARAGAPRVVFASSTAVFGGQAMPNTVSDLTKQTSQTTYGMTKTIGELLINDYSRKGFIDGRSARLPHIIVRPGKPNAAASSFCSGVFREPLNGKDFAVPVPPETLLPLLGYRNCVQSFIHLAELPGEVLGDDRAIFLRNEGHTVHQMIEALKRVALRNGRVLGKISMSHDPVVAKIIQGWPSQIDSARAEHLGFPADSSLDALVQDFIDDFCRVKPATGF